ncbi:MAG: Wzz/FepE/Etk N-terminal domain-containing protein [candidate division Zixibacteria bacterium]|nr:Wzz/FepE/Etk N-terminal domain-containing protein [candidate division Zixibacteria bacterium]
MVEEKSNNPESTSTELENINLYSYLAVLVKYRRFIFFNFIFICFTVGLLSLFLPNWYRAKTTLLPPEKGSLGVGISSSLLGEFSTLSGLSLPMTATPSDVFAAILKSRAVVEPVVQQENLLKVYGVSRMEDGLMEFFSHLQVKVESEGIISIEFEDKNKDRAARVANLLVEELDRVNRMTSTSKAKNARIFIEERLSQTQTNLKAAEDSLRSYQERNKAIVLDEQMKAAVQAAAELKAEMTSAEIQMNVLGKNMSPDHPQIQQLKSRINEIKRQLGMLESGSENTKDKNVLGVTFSQVPSLSLELARLTREVKIQEKLFELLTQQYEQYKIEETKDTPTVQVLDKASPPETKYKPKRAVMVLIAGIVSLFLSVIFSFSLEYIERTKRKQPEDYRKMEEMISLVRKDLASLKNILNFRKSKNQE